MTKHDGRTGTPLYRLWLSIHRRCKYPSQRAWKNYGGRGIRVCPEWDSFENFRAYVLATIGDHPGRGFTLDRIDNDGNYEPGNIRWATPRQQRANRRPVDHAAVARRSAATYRARTTPQQRAANARKGGRILMASLNKAERVERARRAGRLGGRPRKAQPS